MTKSRKVAIIRKKHSETLILSNREKRKVLKLKLAERRK